MSDATPPAIFNARTNTARRREWRRQDRERWARERVLAGRLSRLMATTSRSAASAIAAGRSVTQVRDRLARSMGGLVVGAVTALVSATLADAEEAGKSLSRFERKAPVTRVSAFMKSWAPNIYRNAKRAASTLVSRVERAVSAALAQGLSEREAANLVSQAAGGMARRQASTIARTETHSAQQASLLDFAEDVDEDIPLDKTWLAVHDERVRESHIEADGQTVAIAEPFRVGDAELDVPGDPSGPPQEIINCRCGTAFAPRG